MEPAQNDSLSSGFSEPDISELEQQSSSKVYTIWLLIVLTFLAQLTLALYVLWKCWSYDRTARDKLRPGSYSSDEADLVIRRAHSRSPNNGAPSSATLLSPAMSGSCCWLEDDRRYYPCNAFLPGRPIHWDVAYC